MKTFYVSLEAVVTVQVVADSKGEAEIEAKEICKDACQGLGDLHFNWQIKEVQEEKKVDAKGQEKPIGDSK